MNRKSPPSITIAVLAPVGARDSGGAPEGAAPPADQAHARGRLPSRERFEVIPFTVLP
jgi:hypothetical protein